VNNTRHVISKINFGGKNMIIGIENLKEKQKEKEDSE
jgi:hypothetical protein